MTSPDIHNERRSLPSETNERPPPTRDSGPINTNDLNSDNNPPLPVNPFNNGRNTNVNVIHEVNPSQEGHPAHTESDREPLKDVIKTEPNFNPRSSTILSDNQKVAFY
jgi:hypothetical protein